MGNVVEATVIDRLGASDQQMRPPVQMPDVMRKQYAAELSLPPEGVLHAADPQWILALHTEAKEKGVEILSNVYLPMLPVGWRLAVIPLKADELSDGGIALPEAVQRNNALLEYRGLVAAMGAHCYKDPKFHGQPPWCKVGDLIAYLAYESATYPVNLGGKTGRYIIINDDDVRAVITDPTVLKTYV